MKKTPSTGSGSRSKTKTSGRPRRPAKTPRRGKPTPSKISFNEAPHDAGGFVSLLLRRLSWPEFNSLRQRTHPAGRPTHKLSRAQLLVGLLFHYTVTWAGTFAEHLLLLGMVIADSTLSERRQALPFAVFEELLQRLLRPLPQVSAAAFYRGLRLVAVDGVEFSLPNTEAVNKRCCKGGNQRGRAAFAKLRCAALVELVMHNPLAARLGLHGESEWHLAQGLLASLPEKCLLLTDRLYGCGAFVVAAQKVLAARQGHFLVRVKLGLQVVRQMRRLADGSRLVEIKALDPENWHRVAATIVVREIRATVQRKGSRPVTVRFWTSLLDPQQAPAQELVRLYMSRWEEELYFRELKRELGINDLLRSQTVETAAQEVAAMIIGSSLIAEERATLRPGEELSHRISFIKTWETLEPLWLTLLLGADLLTEKQKQELAERFYWIASQRKMAKKRSRSCPRAVRQRMQPWPRKTNQKSHAGPLEVQIVAVAS
jgi:hypothetical protein